MKLYLSYKVIPEFENLPNTLASSRYRVCFRKSFFHWKQWFGISLIILSIVLWDFFVRKFLPLFGFAISNLLEDILLIVFSFVGAVGYIFMHNQVIRGIYQSEYPADGQVSIGSS